MDDYSGSDAGAALGIILSVVMVGVYLLFIAAGYVVTSLGYSRLFRKVGVESWIGWVPIYNTWKLLEVGGQPGWLAVLLVVPYANFVAVVFLLIGMYRTGIAFTKDGSWVVLAFFLPFVWCFLLARDSEVYDPSRIVAAGFPPPRAGYGSIPPGAPWSPPPGAQPSRAQPPAG